MTRMAQKIDVWLRSWARKGYADGIPDEAPRALEENGRVPSYRTICKALLKNDQTLKALGFARPACDLYIQIKRDELKAKGKRVWEAQQKRMF